MLQTHIAESYTLADLFRVLRQANCVACGSFGALVFLPTLERRCSVCLDKEARFAVVSWGRVKEAVAVAVRGQRYNSSDADAGSGVGGDSKGKRYYKVKRTWNLRPSRKRSKDGLEPRFPIASMKTLPGVYTRKEKQRGVPLWVFSEARFARYKFHEAMCYDEDWMREEERERRVGDALVLRYMASTNIPYLERRVVEENEADGDGGDGLDEEGIWDVQHGVQCVGCRKPEHNYYVYQGRLLELRDKVYSNEGFLEHLGECELAQKEWKDSKSRESLDAEILW